MSSKDKNDTDVLCEAIKTIAGSTGPGLRDTHKQLVEVSKELGTLARTLDDSASIVAGETAKLTVAIKRQAAGSTKLARLMLWTNILLVIATFALVGVAILQLKSRGAQQSLGIYPSLAPDGLAEKCSDMTLPETK